MWSEFSDEHFTEDSSSKRKQDRQRGWSEFRASPAGQRRSRIARPCRHRPRQCRFTSGFFSVSKWVRGFLKLKGRGFALRFAPTAPFPVSAVHVWNGLPTHVTSLGSLHAHHQRNNNNNYLPVWQETRKGSCPSKRIWGQSSSVQ